MIPDSNALPPRPDFVPPARPWLLSANRFWLRSWSSQLSNAIIGQAWIADAVVVDDAGFDKPAQREQMVPVRAIAREARCVLGQDGTILARIQPGNQAVEARARHRSACRATEVIVDDLNVGHAATSARSCCRRWLSRVVIPCDCVDWRR